MVLSELIPLMEILTFQIASVKLGKQTQRGYGTALVPALPVWCLIPSSAWWWAARGSWWFVWQRLVRNCFWALCLLKSKMQINHNKQNKIKCFRTSFFSSVKWPCRQCVLLCTPWSYGASVQVVVPTFYNHCILKERESLMRETSIMTSVL